MNIGDRVTTPHGPATIIDSRPGDDEWVFGRHRPRPLYIVDCQRHRRKEAWVPSKVKPR